RARWCNRVRLPPAELSEPEPVKAILLPLPVVRFKTVADERLIAALIVIVPELVFPILMVPEVMLPIAVLLRPRVYGAEPVTTSAPPKLMSVPLVFWRTFTWP